MANSYTLQPAAFVPFHGPSVIPSAGRGGAEEKDAEGMASIMKLDTVAIAAVAGHELAQLYDLMEVMDDLSRGAQAGASFQAMMLTRLRTAAAAHIRPEDVYAIDPKRFKPEEAFVPDGTRFASADLEHSADAPKYVRRNVPSMASDIKKKREERNYYAPRPSRLFMR